MLKFNFIRHYNADKVLPLVCVDGSSCPSQSWKQFLGNKEEWSQQRWCLEFITGEGLRRGNRRRGENMEWRKLRKESLPKEELL